ncbi:MAG: hypothetical protein FWH37_09080 [Candidatus Bathyarchaeota archaeon]|nr:hypothetical protein [Candidatus Termiticorpusculum sp.]
MQKINVAYFWTPNPIYAGSRTDYNMKQFITITEPIQINAIGLIRNMKDTPQQDNYIHCQIGRTGSNPHLIFDKNVYSITENVANTDQEYIYDLEETIILEPARYYFIFCQSEEHYNASTKPTILFGLTTDTTHFIQSENIELETYYYGLSKICNSGTSTYSGTAGNSVLFNFIEFVNEPLPPPGNGNGNGLTPVTPQVPLKISQNHIIGLIVVGGIIGLIAIIAYDNKKEFKK